MQNSHVFGKWENVKDELTISKRISKKKRRRRRQIAIDKVSKLTNSNLMPLFAVGDTSCPFSKSTCLIFFLAI